MKKEKKMKRYLIDGENVNDVWVNLLDRMKEHDKIVIFYTKNSPHIDYEKVMSIMSMKPKQVKWVKCYDGTNALDFQLCTVLGSMIAKKPKAEYFIVSNDTGYDAAVSYWKKNGYKISRLKSSECVPTKEKPVEEEEDWTTSKRRMNPRRKRVDRHNRNGRKSRNSYYRNEESVMTTGTEETAATKVPESPAKAEEKKTPELIVPEPAAPEEKKTYQRKNNYRRGRFAKMGQSAADSHTPSTSAREAIAQEPASDLASSSEEVSQGIAAHLTPSAVETEKTAMQKPALEQTVTEEKKTEPSAAVENVEASLEMPSENIAEAEKTEETQQEEHYNRRRQDSRKRNGNNRRQNGRRGRRWERQPEETAAEETAAEGAAVAEETVAEEIAAVEESPAEAFAQKEQAVAEEVVQKKKSAVEETIVAEEKPAEETAVEGEKPAEEPVVEEETTAEKIVQKNEIIAEESGQKSAPSVEEIFSKDLTSEGMLYDGDMEEAEEATIQKRIDNSISSVLQNVNSATGTLFVTEEKEETWFRMKPEDLVEKPREKKIPASVAEKKEIIRPIIKIEEILEAQDLIKLEKKSAEQSKTEEMLPKVELAAAEAATTIEQTVEPKETEHLEEKAVVEEVAVSEETSQAEPQPAENPAVAEEATIEETIESKPAEEAVIEETIESKPAEEAVIEETIESKPAEEAVIEETIESKPAEEAVIEETIESKSVEEALAEEPDFSGLLKERIQEKTPCEEETCKQVVACVEQIAVSLSMTNRTLMHNALVAILGAEGGDIIYSILKNQPELTQLMKAKRQRRKNDRLKNYLSLAISVSGMEKAEPEELFQFYHSMAKEELQKIYEECQKKFGPEKGNSYYQIIKKHYHILQKI